MLTKFPIFYYFERRVRYFLFQPEVGVVNSVKFTRDSGCLARDEFLVISEGYHVDLHICRFLLLGTVLHCTSWCGVFPVAN